MNDQDLKKLQGFIEKEIHGAKGKWVPGARALPLLVAESVSIAIRTGAQTEDRRPLKEKPPPNFFPREGWRGQDGDWLFTQDGRDWGPTQKEHWVRAPWQPGDFLYLREAWTEMPGPKGKQRIILRSTLAGANQALFKWRPSIHMKKADAQAWVRVAAVEPVLLQDMTEDEALREGCPTNPVCRQDPVAWFRRLWDGLYPKARWDSGPLWVWRTRLELVRRRDVPKALRT